MKKFDEVNSEQIKQYKKINICGSPGSGKSTLSRQIANLLDIKLFDLDDYLYQHNCKRKSANETLECIKLILNNGSYIIDGTYLTTFENRIKEIELIILIDCNPIICLFRFIKRLIFSNELKCGERFTIKTLLLILQFKRIAKPQIIKLVKKYQKPLIIVNNR